MHLRNNINRGLGRGITVDVSSTITRIRNVGTEENPELIEDMPFESDNDDSDFDFENAYAIRRVYNIEARIYVDSITFESTDILVSDAQDPLTTVTVTPP